MTTISLALFYKQFGEGNLEVGTEDNVVVFNQTSANAPTPSFTATVPTTVTSALPPLTVTFTDTSTTPGGTSISAWLWNFGDSVTSTSQNPTHIYTDMGVYDVTLTVTNADGSASVIQSGLVDIWDTKQVTPSQTILGTQNTVASFTSVATALSVAFTDTSTGSPYEWTWDFGDGNKSRLQNPTNVYALAGTYTVTLSAQNAGGSDISSTTITVT